MSPFLILRRWSKSSRHNSQLSARSISKEEVPAKTLSPPQKNATMLPREGRPTSVGTDSSFEFTSKPTNRTTQSTGPSVGNLSRTDLIVLRHFWDEKFAQNEPRDLHFLKFPIFPQSPSHKDLIPYCEIYHLVKTSPGAKIVSLGSSNGVYIGFELFSGSQLHIDMDDEWYNITHHRVSFKSFDNVVKDPESETIFKSWPKPITIEFLEDEYLKWNHDLTSICWDATEVSELGNGVAQTDEPTPI